MQKNYCTPIPAARISDKVSPELKIATENAFAAEIYAVTAGGRTLLGKYDLKKGLESNRIYPDLGDITGKFEFEINFKDNDGNTEETIRIPYEVVKSDVPSTGMIDGCWITLYHWSEAEGTYFNEGLKNLDADGWRQIIYSMHKAKITSVLIQNVFDAGNYAYQHNMTVDTYDGKAFYPSKLYKNRMPIRCEDPLEVILTAADECGMHVFPGVGMYAWFEFSPDSLEWHKRVTVELNERYAGYIEKERLHVEKFSEMESALLPKDTDYSQIAGLRLEARQKLNKMQPESLGRASRISGVSPADIAVLMIWLKRRKEAE